MSKAATALLFSASDRHPKWDEIASALYALSVTAQTIEMVGRGASDNIHGDRLDEVFGNLAADIQDEIHRIKELLNIDQPVSREVQL